MFLLVFELILLPSWMFKEGENLTDMSLEFLNLKQSPLPILFFVSRTPQNSCFGRGKLVAGEHQPDWLL